MQKFLKTHSDYYSLPQVGQCSLKAKSLYCWPGTVEVMLCHRITEWRSLEGTTGGPFDQAPAPAGSLHLEQAAQSHVQMVWNTSKDTDSTTSLDSLCHSSTPSQEKHVP